MVAALREQGVPSAFARHGLAFRACGRACCQCRLILSLLTAPTPRDDLFHHFRGHHDVISASLLVCSGSFGWLVAVLALVGCLVSGAAAAQTATPQALFAALKQGGYRSCGIGETGPAYADQNAVDGDCATQRNLTWWPRNVWRWRWSSRSVAPGLVVRVFAAAGRRPRRCSTCYTRH
jgi:hypothetical protein